MKDFDKDWANLLALAVENSDRLGLLVWRALLGSAVLVAAANANPELGVLLVWAALRSAGQGS